MRYHPEDKKKTRQRILSVSARRYRSEGLNSVGIANLMADLGMTHGGFYAHFADKEALVAATCEHAFASQLKHWQALQQSHPQQPFRALVEDYLSRQHVEHPETGCLAAALAGEMARRDTRSRQAFTLGIEQLLQHLQHLPDCRLAPQAALSLMLGAVMLARAVSDRSLSENILQQARETLTSVHDNQP
ncbi:TetR/AcrR family transcriptional regulator [Paludibacterium sp. B53371]|uniref:TetR/AcrR family transcriptional regulator n=1 Tax=Paludibacterium sp. B53371 TaxID=2806263 RepID=UPI001C0496DB|nr:TetR/AcrR family transcriptional regulator [Paludibacterium sp. B53371]